ncbi:hypothetical protein C5613_34455 [Rhodococcus opacus]|uniref:Uncharacterized protein n=1 Tax=Rhodococcus opacus TaxID=37919 RepID=A0A2S8IRE5_RHOOP|nr:hypothetical protein C5613_34455 [Rhodococcus opacus]
MNRQEGTARLLLKRGNPIEPFRFPDRASDQFDRAAAQFAIPELYASFEFSGHHGCPVSGLTAMAFLTVFQCLRRLYADHDTSGVNSESGISYDRSAARWSRFAFTRDSAQL